MLILICLYFHKLYKPELEEFLNQIRSENSTDQCPHTKLQPASIPRNIYSQISVIRTPIIRNYWVIRRRWTVPNFFSLIYCNKTTNYSNFDYPKSSIFRSDSSVPIEESAIKLPFKIRSPKVTHGDHDFFVWSSSIYTPE